MTWFSPIINLPEAPAKIVRRDGTVMPNTSKAVTIDGIRYASMADACRSLGCSYSVVYRKIGEKWRYSKKTTKGKQ